MKICFVALNAFPVVDPSASGLFGGAETHLVILARALAKYTKHEIYFVVRNPHLKQPREIDGVTWIPWRDFWADVRDHVADYLDLKALPKICFIRWSWSLLWEIPLLALSNPWRRIYRSPRRRSQLYREIDADLFCSYGVTADAVRMVYNAQLLNHKSLIFLEHDMEVDARNHPGSNYISPNGERAEESYWTLKNADQIIAQTELQKQLLKSRFDRDCEILLNPFDLESWEELADCSGFENPWGAEKYVLWIGRADTFHKLPARFLELARLCPSLNFLMIMNPHDPDVEKQIKQQAPENLKIIDAVPYSEMPGAFRHANAYVSTSAQEGFPNVFLQAIASGVPIVSSEVSGEFLEESKAGVCVFGDTNLARDLLHGDAITRRVDSRTALEYLKKYYLCSSVCGKLENILEEKFQQSARAGQ